MYIYTFKFRSNTIFHEGQLSVSVYADNDVEAVKLFKEKYSLLSPFATQILRRLDD